MPRTALDFTKTIIYKLVCDDVNVSEVYVGSTTNFTKRKSNHRSLCHNPKQPKYNLLVYQYIRSKGGFAAWSMIEIEKFPCSDKHESSKRERYWIETLHATLNKAVPSRTRLEYGRMYLKEHKEFYHDYQKEYRKVNNSKIRAMKGKNCLCECGACYTNSNKSRHMQSTKHQKYINEQSQFEYTWEDGTTCTAQDYENYKNYQL